MKRQENSKKKLGTKFTREQARRLKFALHKMGYSDGELAMATGCSTNAIIQFRRFHGLRANPATPTGAKQIATWLTKRAAAGEKRGAGVA